MVGKGIETKSSRIFQQCYVKCCKLQNLTPLNNVIPSANGKVLDFCVDRIKYADWPPILNALSCDLSLHSVTIKCRQQVKTVLEHVDCERLARTVARCVLLTKFMLSNLVEALVQLLNNNTLLETLALEGLPLRGTYLQPLAQALGGSSVARVSLVRCAVGDAGCALLCGVLRARRGVTALELAGCELGAAAGASLADLVHYQKLHRYSENWVHTLRYRAPELDAMAGLRRISLADNPQLGDEGLAALLDALADDLWIKELVVSGCGLSEAAGVAALRTLRSNTTLEVLLLTHNHLAPDTLSRVRAALAHNKKCTRRDHTSPARLVRRLTTTNNNTNYINKDQHNKEYTEVLEEQLQEEISHRQQLEELNVQLVQQVQDLKQQQLRLWTSSGSTPSLGASSPSGELSSSSGSSSSVPIDQSTLSYIQHAFSDIYVFIKNNQCLGRCAAVRRRSPRRRPPHKETRSDHALGGRAHTHIHQVADMFERQVGDTHTHTTTLQDKRHGVERCASVSTDTLVCTPTHALLSSEEEDESDHQH